MKKILVGSSETIIPELRAFIRFFDILVTLAPPSGEVEKNFV
jgi:hypothetical protein